MGELAAYLAGLFDGEGCITIGTSRDTPKGKTRHSLRVQLRMAHKKSVYTFFETYGGHLYEHPNQYGKHVLYTWTLHGVNAKPFLEDILPYSIAKSEVIALALQFLTTITGSRNLSQDIIDQRQHIRNEIQRLNQLD